MIEPVQVVVAYDFSPSAEEALMRAVDVAVRAPQHVLHIVCALDSSASIRRATHLNADDIQRAVFEHVTVMLAGSEASSEVQFFMHVRIGRPATQILDVAKEVGADLVFIGSHGQTGIERFLLGSISERVAREAHCPVMVVRAKTYKTVNLEKVVPYEHERHTFNAPHRYAPADRSGISPY
jgi:nucleotide-binding universal stress UspA family protein